MDCLDHINGSTTFFSLCHVSPPFEEPKIPTAAPYITAGLIGLIPQKVVDKIYFIDNEKKVLCDFSMDENNWNLKWSRDQIKVMLLEQSDAFWHYDFGMVRTQLSVFKQPAALPQAVLMMANRLKNRWIYYLYFEDDFFIKFDVRQTLYLHREK